MLNVRQGGATRQPAVFSTIKYTTPSLCCRQGGTTYYVPLVRDGGYTYISGGNAYGYSDAKMPRIAARYGGAAYHAVNVLLPFMYATYRVSVVNNIYNRYFMLDITNISLSRSISYAVRLYANGTFVGELGAGATSVSLNRSVTISASTTTIQFTVKCSQDGYASSMNLFTQSVSFPTSVSSRTNRGLIGVAKWYR